MFGQNTVRKQVISDGTQLLVKEMFDTLQGEGPDAGCPAFFIRLGGCNLRCLFCDTDFDTNLVWTNIEHIVSRANASNRHLVVITGGEPFRQNIQPLCVALCAAGHRVQVETAGTLWVPGIPDEVEVVVSPKTPQIDERIRRRANAFKYIVRQGQTDSATGLPNINPQTGRSMRIALPNIEARHESRVWIQPCDDHNAAANAQNLVTAVDVVMTHGYRLSLQQHKIVGLP